VGSFGSVLKFLEGARMYPSLSWDGKQTTRLKAFTGDPHLSKWVMGFCQARWVA
jgi:hypothetical protein